MRSHPFPGADFTRTRAPSGARLQRIRDELTRVEQELDALWLSPTRARAELEQGERELADLRAAISALGGAERRRHLRFAASCAGLLAAALVLLHLAGVA